MPAFACCNRASKSVTALLSFRDGPSTSSSMLKCLEDSLGLRSRSGIGAESIKKREDTFLYLESYLFYYNKNEQRSILKNRHVPRSEYFSLQKVLLPPKQISTVGKAGSSFPCSIAS